MKIILFLAVCFGASFSSACDDDQALKEARSMINKVAKEEGAKTYNMGGWSTRADGERTYVFAMNSPAYGLRLGHVYVDASCARTGYAYGSTNEINVE